MTESEQLVMALRQTYPYYYNEFNDKFYCFYCGRTEDRTHEPYCLWPMICHIAKKIKGGEQHG